MSKVLKLSKQYADFGLFLSCQTRNLSLFTTSKVSVKIGWIPKCTQNTAGVPYISYSNVHTSAMDKNKSSINNSPKEVGQFPRLMKEPIEVMMPSLTKYISNVIKIQFVVKPYFDPEFNAMEFLKGSKHAVVVVSSMLAKGDFSSLKDLFDPEALAEVERNFSQFTVNQRVSLHVSQEDMYFAVPYEVGIMFDDKPTGGVQERFLEILMSFRFCKGFRDIPDFIPGPSSERHYRDRIVLCNMRFHRNYTKGYQSPWIINFVNYFRIPEDP